MRKLTTRLLFAFTIWFSAATCSFGQSAADFSKGTVAVVIRDASGAVVPDAEITLTGPLGTLKARSSDRGDYAFPSLNPGQYKVSVTKPGFSTSQVSSIQVDATKTATVPVSLEAGQVTQTVEVQDVASTIDTTSTTVQSNITASQYQSLPVTRNVTALMYLAPGVADGGGTGTANPSISGASGLENQYIIDGINDTDAGYGGFGVYSDNYGSLGTGVNFDFVQEVQVKTGGFEAQYGQALGGIVNVVTKSGTNDLHGSIYGYASPGWAEPTYNQVNNFPRVSSPQAELLTQPTWDFGFNVGGPIMKNKFFWYGAFDPSWTRIDERAPQGFALRTDYRFLTRTRRSLNWAGKLNYNITDSQRLEATGFGDPSQSPSMIQGSVPELGGALNRNDLLSSSALDYGTRNWSVKYSGTFGPATIVSASFAWNHSEFTETPATNLYQVQDFTAPTITSAFTYEGGLGYIGNNQGNNKQYNAMVSRIVNVLGSHNIDLGYSYNDVTYDAVHLYSGPQYALPDWSGVDAGDVGKLVNGGLFYEYGPTRAQCAAAGVSTCFRIVRGNFSNPNVGTDTSYNDAFLEDAWQINRFLTLKGGVRWEQQKLNGNLNNYTFAANWAPRIGFIVDPTGHGKTKLFGNWGRFFEKIPQDLAVRSLSLESGYNNAYLYSLPVNGVVDPLPATTFSATGVSPTIIYGGTKAAYQEEVVAGFEQDLGHNLVLRGSFTHRTLVRGLEDTSGITAEQALAGAPQQYVIQNPSVHSDTFHNAVLCADQTACADTGGYTADSGALGPDGLADGFPDMRRVYNAFEISAEKRFSSRWSLIANYRLAKLFGNYEGLFRNDNGQSDPNITSLFDFVNSPLLESQFAVGVLPTDRRNIVNLYGSYQAMKNLTLGAGYVTQSGTPITGFDAHPVYGNAGEIPIGVRGAFGRTPWQGYVDARAAYTWAVSERVHTQFGADMFNIGNRQTETQVDQDNQLSGGDPNADFLKPLRYHRPFHAQFSFRVEF